MQKGTSTCHAKVRRRRFEIFQRTISVVGKSVLLYDDRAAELWLVSSGAWMVFVTMAGFILYRRNTLSW